MTASGLRTLVRPAVTIVLTLAVVGFVGVGISVPDRLWDALFMVLGMWFGSRTTTKP